VIESVKLDTYQIPKFYTELEELGVTPLAPRSSFEVYRGELDGSIISIDLNGQVTHSNFS